MDEEEREKEGLKRWVEDARRIYTLAEQVAQLRKQVADFHGLERSLTKLKERIEGLESRRKADPFPDLERDLEEWAGEHAVFKVIVFGSDEAPVFTWPKEVPKRWELITYPLHFWLAQNGYCSYPEGSKSDAV